MTTEQQVADRERARRALREGWGSHPGRLSDEDLDWLEGLRQGDELMLDTAQRLAGDTYKWRAETKWQARASHFANVL